MMKQYDYEKDNIKNSLTINQIQEIVSEFGGEPKLQNDILICKTICHHNVNELNEASHKLYYYDNTHLFRCYTGGCSEPTFDIFELIRKIKTFRDNREWSLPEAIEFIANYFNFSPIERKEQELRLEDFDYIDEYDRISNISLETQIVELKEYDDKFLKNFPHPIIQPWIDDGISQEIMNYFEICYDPKNCGIIIPHRDIDGKLIGIRERLLIEEDIERFGKYRPLKVNQKMYNHPLSFSLYGLYQNKEHIEQIKKAFVFESEKSVMQYATMFGQENNIACAICGSSFINYQAWLLINLGVKEIIIGLDRQFQELGDNEHKKLVKNLKGIQNKYGRFVTISYLFDKECIFNYKSSPTDEGIDKFLKLYNERVNLYD